MMRRALAVAVVALITATAGAISLSAQGQGRGRGLPPPTNLQVFPSDMAAGQVIQIMQAFSAALGVTCAHCHVFVGPGDPMNDFASDMKPQKEIARNMVRMVREMNPMVAKAVAPKAEATQLSCAMCHRGAAIPVVEPGSPGAPPPPRGGGPGRGN